MTTTEALILTLGKTASSNLYHGLPSVAELNTVGGEATVRALETDGSIRAVRDQSGDRFLLTKKGEMAVSAVFGLAPHF